MPPAGGSFYPAAEFQFVSSMQDHFEGRRDQRSRRASVLPFCVSETSTRRSPAPYVLETTPDKRATGCC